MLHHTQRAMHARQSSQRMTVSTEGVVMVRLSTHGMTYGPRREKPKRYSNNVPEAEGSSQSLGRPARPRGICLLRRFFHLGATISTLELNAGSRFAMLPATNSIPRVPNLTTSLLTAKVNLPLRTVVSSRANATVCCGVSLVQSLSRVPRPLTLTSRTSLDCSQPFHTRHMSGCTLDPLGTPCLNQC